MPSLGREDPQEGPIIPQMVVGESNDTISKESGIENKGIKHIIQMKTMSIMTQGRNQPNQNRPRSPLKKKNFCQEDSIT